MKKTLLILIITGMITILSAHPASKVEAKFDLASKILTINYMHSVKNNAKHFINKVSVDLNGKEIIEQKVDIQDDNKKGTLIYKIPEAKISDKIEITTKCNKGGKKSVEIIIAKKKEMKMMKK